MLAEDAGFEAVPEVEDAVEELPGVDGEADDAGLLPYGLLEELVVEPLVDVAVGLPDALAVVRVEELPEDPNEDPVPVEPGFVVAEDDPEGGTDVPPEEEGVLPGRAVLVELVEPVDEAPVDEAGDAGFELTFSAARSIVTGRLEEPEDAEGVSGLPDDPLPPEEDVPPEDLLSVVICTSPEPAPAPEPSAPRPSLYTPLCEAVPPRQRLFRAAIEGLPRIWLTLR